MKTNTRNILASIAVALTFTGSLVAQTSVTTTTSAGTVSEFSPDTIVIRSETSPEPIRYSYSKTTTYVDETGAPVSMETVKSGLPVTVSYVREGDRLVASRVIVRRAAPAATTTTTETPVVPAAPEVIEKKTTTTTTSK